MPINEQDEVYAGIDIAKNTLEAYSPNGGSKSVPNSEEGIARLITWLKSHATTHIVIEPTGGYERLLMRQCRAQDLKVLRPNAAWVRHHAKASGRRAKTDKIDARLLYDYGLAHRKDLHPKEPPSPAQEALEGLVKRREQLTKILRDEENRRKREDHADIRQDIEEHINELRERRRKIQGQINELLAQEKELKAKSEAMEKIKGVGCATAAALLAHIPELGTLNRRQISRLGGVAPINDDSGEHQGDRFMQSGRARVRSTLFMACMSAIRYHPKITLRYQHLLKAGKPKKVAIGACMRNLLIEINVAVRTAMT